VLQRVLQQLFSLKSYTDYSGYRPLCTTINGSSYRGVHISEARLDSVNRSKSESRPSPSRTISARHAVDAIAPSLAMPPKHARNAITTFRRLPKELFRVNHGWQVNLRPKRNPDFAYDIVTAETDAAIESGGVRADVKEAGLYRSHTVLPRALQPGNYKRMYPHLYFFFFFFFSLMICVRGRLQSRRGKEVVESSVARPLPETPWLFLDNIG
jgi:hypothetical protein